MPAQVAQDRGQFGIGDTGHHGQHVGAVGSCQFTQTLPAFRARERDQRLIILVVHLVNAAAQGIAPRLLEQGLQQVTILHLDHAPVALGKELFELGRADAGNHTVEALTI